MASVEDNTAIADPKAEAAGFIPQSEKMPQKVIGNDALDELVKDGKLKPAQRGDLVLPGLTTSLPPVLEEALSQHIPIYVIDAEYARPQAQKMKTREGKDYVLINEWYHRQSEEEARAQMPVNAQFAHDKHLADFPDTLRENLKASGKSEQEIQQSLDNLAVLTEFVNTKIAEAGRAGIDSDVLLDINLKQGESMLTQEGKGILLLDTKYLTDNLSTPSGLKILEGTISHEFAHLEDRDGSAAMIALRHNDARAASELDRGEELLADLKGSGPRGSRTPEAKAEDFVSDVRLAIPAYNEKHPDAKLPVAKPGWANAEEALKDPDLKKVSDWWGRNELIHPDMGFRIAAQEDMAKHMHEEDAKYAQAHGGQKIEDIADAQKKADALRQEEKTVLQEVLSDIRSGTLGAPLESMKLWDGKVLEGREQPQQSPQEKPPQGLEEHHAEAARAAGKAIVASADAPASSPPQALAPNPRSAGRQV